MIIRPKEVENAIKLMLTATVFGALVGYLNIPVAPEHEYFQVYIYITLLGILMNGYFVYKVSQNRDWARKLYIILTLATFVYYLPRLLLIFASTPVNGFLQLINMLIQLASVYFLMNKESIKWFRIIKTGKDVN